MLTTALRKWLAPSSAAPPTRPATGRGLRMENLEDRTVPATYTVGSGYATIQAALNAAAAHSGSDTVVVPAGTYTENLVVNDSGAVTLKASGTVTLKSAAAPASVTLGADNIGAAVIDVYGKNVTVDGFKVDGAAGPANLFAGIRVIKGGSATIKNNAVANLNTAGDANFGIGIQVGTNKGGGSAGTAKVTNNIVTGYLGAGVLVDGGSASATVKSNTVTGRGLANGGVAQYGVQVSRGATARVEGNRISGNDVDGAVPGGSNPATASAGIFFYQDGNKNSVAAKNTVSGNDYGILVQESNGSQSRAIEIVNNDVTGNNGYAGIEVVSSNNVDVVNNDVFCNTTWNGVAVEFSSRVEVAGNSVSGNANADGIYVLGGSANDVLANDSYDNGLNGILVQDSTGNQVFNNLTFGNTENGIKVLGGSANDIWLGASTCNVLDGILLQDTSCSTVVGNALLSNGGYGLRLVNADGTFVALNLIVGNDEGSIRIDADSTGTTTIANLTDTPPEREGATGSGGICSRYTNSHSHADDDCAGLED